MQVSRAEILRELRETRALYRQIANESPAEQIENIAIDITRFGEDDSEYVGDDYE